MPAERPTLPLRVNRRQTRAPPRTSGYDYAGQDPINNFDLAGESPKCRSFLDCIGWPARALWHAFKALAVAAFGSPDIGQIKVEWNDRTIEHVQRHGLSVEDDVAPILEREQGFTFRNKEGVKRIGWYDRQENIFVIASEPRNGVSRLISAFKPDDGEAYVERQIARRW